MGFVGNLLATEAFGSGSMGLFQSQDIIITFSVDTREDIQVEDTPLGRDVWQLVVKCYVIISAQDLLILMKETREINLVKGMYDWKYLILIR